MTVGIEIRERSPGAKLYEALKVETATLTLGEKLGLMSAWRNGYEWEELSDAVRARFESAAVRAGR